MSEWRDVTLGEVLELQRGFDITKAQQRLGPVPVVSSSGITSSHDTAKCSGPGVVIGRKGSLGTVFYIADDYWPHDTTLWVRDFRGNNPLFCYFLLKTLRLEQFDAGASNPTLNRNHAHLIRTRIPDVGAQERIADVLSGFSDLIENNRRRIAILDETARSLYREWFVRYRFPGHESVQVVDSPRGRIPATWHVSALGDLIELRYGKSLKATVRRPGQVPVVGSSGVVGFHDAAIAEGPGIVVGRKGNVGSVIWVDRPFFPIDTTYFVVSDLPMHWLRYVLEDVTFQDSHAAVPGLNREDALRAEVLEPPVPLMQRFAEAASPILELAVALEEITSNCANARDLLLPRLVSGAIDVDSLGVDDVFGWTDSAGAAATT